MASDTTTVAADSGDWTVQRILDWTTSHFRKHGSETPRLDAEILLAHVRHCARIELYTHFADVLTAEEREKMRELVQRRARSEPVAYLVGHREFYGLEFEVGPEVLIPRPDTETLVLEALEWLKSRPQPRVLEIGTGTGCIPVALAVNHPGVQVVSIDISPEALRLAQRNVERHGVADRVRLLQADTFPTARTGDQDGPYDMIVSNPPYVGEPELDQLQSDVQRFEPRVALISGPDGLDMIRRIIDESPAWLVPGGSLMLEIAPGQADTVVRLLQTAGVFESMLVIRDLAGQQRVVRAELQPVVGSPPH